MPVGAMIEYICGIVSRLKLIISLPFETPSKKNSRVTDRRTGRTFPNAKFTKWHAQAKAWLYSHYAICNVPAPVEIEFTFTHGTHRRSDSDNKVSSILDLLVDVGILDDDCWKVVPKFSVENLYCKGAPMCEIRIKKMCDST